MALSHRGLGWVVVLAACSAPDGPALVEEKVADVAGCELLLEPPELEFGYVPNGVQASLPVSLRNAGDTRCAIVGTQRFGRLPALALEPDELPLLIPAHSAVTAAVMVEGGELLTYNAELELLLEDGGHPRLHVLVEGGDSKLVLNPHSLQVHSRVGCAARGAPIEVVNVGTLPAKSFSAKFVPEGPFRFLAALPSTLEAGAKVAIDVDVSTVTAGAQAAILELSDVHDNGQITSEQVTLSATIDPHTLQEQRVIAGPQLDVLLVIDDSPAMIEEQTLLAQNLELLRGQLDASGVDYRLGVTSTDISASGPRGVLLPRDVAVILDPTSSTAWSPLALVGVSGSPATAGLEAAALALSAPLATGHNRGLFRLGAFLRVVIITANDDHAGGGLANLSDAAEHLYGESLFGQLGVFFVAGPCTGPNDVSAVAPDAYLEQFQFTPPLAQICNPAWGLELPLVSSLPFNSALYTLAQRPDPSTLLVEVDGLQIPATSAGETHWRYDDLRQAILFESAWAPANQSEVVIRYLPACP